MQKLLILLTLCLFSGIVAAQQIFVDADNLVIHEKHDHGPEQAFEAEIDLDQLRSTLANTPRFGESDNIADWASFELPLPDGRFETFRFVEAPYAEEPLYSNYSDIRTYRVVGDRGTNFSGNLAVTPKGVTGLIYGENYSFFIEPIEGENHRSYLRHSDADADIHCDVVMMR